LSYKFKIDATQFENILYGNREYIQLTPLQKDEEKALLNAFISFKDNKDCNDINDLQSGITFTVTFDPNGGTGGNGNQPFLAVKKTQVNGGIPNREGYKFLYWLAPDGNTIRNDDFIFIASDVTLKAEWGKPITNMNDLLKLLSIFKNVSLIIY